MNMEVTRAYHSPGSEGNRSPREQADPSVLDHEKDELSFAAIRRRVIL